MCVGHILVVLESCINHNWSISIVCGKLAGKQSFSLLLFLFVLSLLSFSTLSPSLLFAYTGKPQCTTLTHSLDRKKTLRRKNKLFDVWDAIRELGTVENKWQSEKKNIVYFLPLFLHLKIAIFQFELFTNSMYKKCQQGKERPFSSQCFWFDSFIASCS